MFTEIKRGKIYSADMEQGVGSEQNGDRPVLIIQNDKGNQYSGTVIVAAITSRRKGKLPTHCATTAQAGLVRASIVMLEQMRTIDKSRLTALLGALDDESMKQPLYFECETYSSRMLVDKPVAFPADSTLNDWAELLKQENPAITEMAELPNGYAFMRYEMMHTVMQNVQIKLCANCGRYFINTGRSDKEYCPRPIEGQPDKTCESMGALLKHQNKAKNSEIIREYNTAYKRANSSKRIGNLSDKDFTAWSIEAREKRDLCLSGDLSREDFTEWLNRDRIYRKRG